MNQETFEIQQTKTGTTIHFFDTTIDLNQENVSPAFLVLSQNNSPLSLQTFDGKELWVRTPDNNYGIFNSQNYNYITGGTYQANLDYVLDDKRKNKIKTNFINDNIIRSSGGSISHVFFSERLMDDMFATVSLHRSFSSLDTLNIYNNLVNSFPVQNSDTGVIFGRLMATQKIKDRNGKNIKIPLKNVPIGIFNPSDEYPEPISVNDDGNRLTFNLREASVLSEYFNSYSFSSDTQNFLQSGALYNSIPEQYRYITSTNDEGEFILHNVPVGVQNLVFEVDLFKQGLTKDEISMNFYPFPNDDRPNIDSLPCFYYRTLPINVIPCWGDGQTGYTETNINANIDLRKWTTYYVSPISVQGNTIEKLKEKGVNTNLKLDIRDMSLQGFPKKTIQLIEVFDVFDREQEQYLVWNNEILQIKKFVEFRDDNFHVFKLPSNIYDPIGSRTDIYGNATNSKGVWLCGYQFLMYYDDKNTIFRSTGLKKSKISEDLVLTRDHSRLNINNYDLSVKNSEAPENIGSFPYERPWDAYYPSKYSIPSIPTIANPNFNQTNIQGKRILETPKFLDGDLVGSAYMKYVDSSNVYGGVGGFGVSYDDDKKDWIKNNFSKVISKNFIFKYEKTNLENEEYSNGYKPNDPDFQVNPSSSYVLKGEEFQRVESGYGYWLKPEGWAKIAHYGAFGGNDAVYRKDTENTNRQIKSTIVNGVQEQIHITNDYLNSIEHINTTSGRQIFLNMGFNTTIKEGSLDIYRVVDPSPSNLEAPNPTLIPTYGKFLFGDMYMQRGKNGGRIFISTENSGSGEKNKFWKNQEGDGGLLTLSEMKLEIRNNGSFEVEIKGIKIPSGKSVEFFGAALSDTGSFANMVLDLPGNSSFDYETYQYTKARYILVWKNIRLYDPSGSLLAGSAQPEGPVHERYINNIDLDAKPEGQVPIYFLRSDLINVNTFCDGRTSVGIFGMGFINPETNKGSWYSSSFSSANITPSCPGNMPYEVNQ